MKDIRQTVYFWTIHCLLCIIYIICSTETDNYTNEIIRLLSKYSYYLVMLISLILAFTYRFLSIKKFIVLELMLLGIVIFELIF